MSIFSRWMDKRIDAYQTELIRTHYAEVENMYRQMRTWRHDYRNHLQTMKGYAAAGDLPAICHYLDELDTDLASVEPVLKTGNTMTDAILNSKISLARAREIQVVTDAHVPVALTTPELELCAVLGNLFDNAIEASLALPPGERQIRVYMDMKGTRLYICFTNRRLAGPQQRGWRVHHRDTAPAVRPGAARTRQRLCLWTPPPFGKGWTETLTAAKHTFGRGGEHFITQNLQFVPGIHTGAIFYDMLDLRPEEGARTRAAALLISFSPPAPIGDSCLFPRPQGGGIDGKYPDSIPRLRRFQESWKKQRKRKQSPAITPGRTRGG